MTIPTCLECGGDGTEDCPDKRSRLFGRDWNRVFDIGPDSALGQCNSANKPRLYSAEFDEIARLSVMYGGRILTVGPIAVVKGVRCQGTYSRKPSTCTGTSRTQPCGGGAGRPATSTVTVLGVPTSPRIWGRPFQCPCRTLRDDPAATRQFRPLFPEPSIRQKGCQSRPNRPSRHPYIHGAPRSTANTRPRRRSPRGTKTGRSGLARTRVSAMTKATAMRT